MKKFFDYFIPTIIGLMFVILICCLKNAFKLETSKEVFHVLVDAFFAVGCVIFCLGAIAYSANKGAFTMLGYSMKRFISLFSKKMDSSISRSYAEYRAQKLDNPKPVLHLIIVGTVYIAISLVLLIFYYK